MNSRDNPSKPLQDPRPNSPHPPPEARPSIESTPKAWLHMASFGSQSSATPTPSASALRRAAAAIQSDSHTHAHAHGSSSGTGSKISAILGTVGSSSRGAGVGPYSSPRPHTRSDSTQQTTPSSTSGGLSSAASATMSALNLAVSHTPLKNTPPRSQTPYDGYRIGGSSTGFSSSSTLVPVINSNLGNPGASEKDNPWGVLFVHVLPLFNRDPLRIPIEDLNQLVKKHMNVILSRNPSKAITQLESDVSELLMAGMVTLNSKLSSGNQNSNGSQNGLNGVDDDKLIQRVVELWGFFWDQVLPYAEGVSVDTNSPVHPKIFSYRYSSRFTRTRTSPPFLEHRRSIVHLHPARMNTHLRYLEHTTSTSANSLSVPSAIRLSFLSPHDSKQNWLNGRLPMN